MFVTDLICKLLRPYGRFVPVFTFAASPTLCPRSSGLFYTVTYYIKLVTSSWTDSIIPSHNYEFYCKNENIYLSKKFLLKYMLALNKLKPRQFHELNKRENTQTW